MSDKIRQAKKLITARIILSNGFMIAIVVLMNCTFLKKKNNLKLMIT